MEKLTKSYLKKIILCANTRYRVKFKKHFKEEIHQFVELTLTAFNARETIQVINVDRKIIIDGFIYKALQDIISAFNIFISGYIVPPGNLMRQYHESVAWAILCSTNQLPYYNKIKEIWDAAKARENKKDNKIEFSKGLKIVNDNLHIFSEIKKDSWKRFIKIRNFYHNLSHSSLLSISTNAVMDAKGAVVLGAYFDRGKIKLYKKEITRMTSAAELLPNIIQVINQQIKKENL